MVYLCRAGEGINCFHPLRDRGFEFHSSPGDLCTFIRCLFSPVCSWRPCFGLVSRLGVLPTVYVVRKLEKTARAAGTFIMMIMVYPCQVNSPLQITTAALPFISTRYRPTARDSISVNFCAFIHQSQPTSTFQHRT